MTDPRIVSVETFVLSTRLALVRIETDDGLVGWGEPVLEGRAHSVARTVQELTPQLVGEPAHVERLWQRMVKEGFYRGGPSLGSAVAGVDQALWDLLGKRTGLPVHELLGGPVRDTLTIYAPCHGDTPEELRERAAELVDAGYRLVKTAPGGPRERFENPAGIATEVARMEALRDVLGDERSFAIDFHGRLSAPSAKRLLAALEHTAPTFVEEPVAPQYQHELGRLTGSTTIPIATGERLYDRWQVAPVLGLGISLLQPDVSHCFGISEAMRIAAVASVHDVAIAPHCATGPLALASCVQVGFASHDVVFQECQLSVHDRGVNPFLSIVDADSFRYADGALLRPTRPGLGVEVDEERVRAWAANPDDVPLVRWQQRDGNHAEW
ncbi:galactonate dehydratase [Occultella kanbiaonis]|uniref:galactonate dehydratase n=1 Tax=Occultella kanbiaonis TaxID=2675754 RepID=UPI0013D0F7F8|nr:galactonate dehydratase [Occultella kanbiaonis]